MTVFEFNRLKVVVQEEVIFDNGTFVLNEVKRELIFDVYELFDFFVKVSYNLSNNGYSAIEAFAINDWPKFFKSPPPTP